MQAHIQEKDEHINEAKERYDILKDKIYNLLRQKYSLFVKRIYFNEILFYYEMQKHEKRIKAYSKNFMYRRKMRLLFGSWRGVTH
jgi:hypothetical protein